MRDNVITPQYQLSATQNILPTFTLVILTAANVNYEVVLVDVGSNGRVSDDKIQSNSNCFEMFESKGTELSDSEGLEKCRTLL